MISHQVCYLCFDETHTYACVRAHTHTADVQAVLLALPHLLSLGVLLGSPGTGLPAQRAEEEELVVSELSGKAPSHPWAGLLPALGSCSWDPWTRYLVSLRPRVLECGMRRSSSASWGGCVGSPASSQKRLEECLTHTPCPANAGWAPGRLYCTSRYRGFYRWKVWGEPASTKSVGLLFPTALPLCHISVTLELFQTCFPF